MTARRPAVAGLFYPADAAEMDAQLSRLLASGERAPAQATRAAALVVPHAGWMYSGRIAGAVYGGVEVPQLVVVLGPNHSGRGAAAAIVARGAWALPGAEVPIAEPLARAIVAGCPGVQEDDHAHRREHSIEVQLPFLRRRRTDVAFVPIVLSRASLQRCVELGRAVASAVARSVEPALIVCSTDLNHYEPQEVSERKDRLAIEALLALDPARLFDAVETNGISMCGVAPAAATLAAIQALGVRGGRLVGYATSADASGDRESVVGYAGLVFG